MAAIRPDGAHYPIGSPGRVHMVETAEFSKAAREGKAHMQILLHVFACVMAPTLLAKASHTAKDEFKSDSLPLEESHTQRAMQTGVGGIWGYFCKQPNINGVF